MRSCNHLPPTHSPQPVGVRHAPGRFPSFTSFVLSLFIAALYEDFELVVLSKSGYARRLTRDVLWEKGLWPRFGRIMAFIQFGLDYLAQYVPPYSNERERLAQLAA